MDDSAEQEALFLESDTVVESLDLTVDDEKTQSVRSSHEIASLVQEGLVIVQPLARKIAHQVRRATDVDELVSVGQTALFDAARSYDPARSPFIPYATNRVRWAMIDSVRRHTHGRSAAARARAMAALERVSEASKEPEVEPLQSETTYQERLKKALATEACALFMGLTCSTEDPVSTEPQDSPEEALIRRRASVAVREALAELSEKHRQIVERHYFHGERFDHIAEGMGVSKSWLSRMHAQAIEKLGEKLRQH